MKCTLTRLVAMVCLLISLSATANAQLYTFTNDEDGAPGTVVAGVTASDLTGVNGVTYINACGTGFSSDTWSTSAGPFSTAFSAVQVTLTPGAGNEMTVTAMQFDFGRNPQGPTKMRFAYSTNGGVTWVNNGTDFVVPSGSCGSGGTFTWDMPDFTTSNAVLFRMIGWAAGNVNGQARIYNGIISGSVCTQTTWYADADGDSYGDAGVTTMACNAPVGYVADNQDCDDANNTVYPSATEICDGLDNDCDAEIDENLITAVMSPLGSVYTCKGDPFMFSVEPCAGCTYQWFKNDNVILGATGTTYSTTKPAYYNVQVTIPGGCFDLSDYALLTTELNPNANIYYPNGLNLCAPTPGTNIIVKVGYTATNTYQWYKDGVPYTGAGATEYRIFPSEAGDYYCSITAASGCNRVTAVATVINSCKLENATEQTLTVFPNPASGSCQISGDLNMSNGVARVIITDLSGKTVYNAESAVLNGKLQVKIDTDAYESGLYVINVVAEGQTMRSSLVIE